MLVSPREETIASARRTPLLARMEPRRSARPDMGTKRESQTLLRTWAINAGLTSMANNTEPGAMRRSISVVMAPVPMPSSTIIRARSKSMGRNRAEARDRELGNNDAVTDKDRSEEHTSELQ